MKVIYVTCASQQDAERIVRHCLEKRLIGCANIMPSTSLYTDNGTINQKEEVVVIAKTMKEHALVVIDEIKRIHQYDLPCIMEFDAQATQEYRAWMEKQLCKS